MNDIGKAKIKVLQDTKMFDYLLQEYASLTDGTSPPPGNAGDLFIVLVRRRATVLTL